ncbi:MAG TPA: hypothetical protein VFQ79_12605 [Bryobacteraceae bacterium]|nr:hypothetical protein [Bryobacteraceae bacterium]
MATFNFFTASKGFEDESVWLTQAAIADLFQTTPQNITLHIGAIYEEGELGEEATCKEYLQVRQEGSRQVTRRLKHYSLNVVLAVAKPRPVDADLEKAVEQAKQINAARPKRKPKE